MALRRFISLLFCTLVIFAANSAQCLTSKLDINSKNNLEKEYIHNWETGTKPPLSTLKMVCNNLKELKSGDFVYITVQDKENLYELAGVDFEKEGSVYKVERTGEKFAFKHPASTGFLFFNSPSYYIGVRKDSDVLDMFHNNEGCETSFTLIYHEKLNGFVMKNCCDNKCLTVCDRFFGRGPCFRHDKCAAVRIYKIPAYSYERKAAAKKTKPVTAKKEEAVAKKKTKDDAISAAKSAGRGNSASLSTKDDAASTGNKEAADVRPTSPTVKINKKVIVHRKLPRKKAHKKQFVTVDTSVIVSLSTTVCSAASTAATATTNSSSTTSSCVSELTTSSTAPGASTRVQTSITTLFVTSTLCASKPPATSVVKSTIALTSSHHVTHSNSIDVTSTAFVTSVVEQVKSSTKCVTLLLHKSKTHHATVTSVLTVKKKQATEKRSSHADITSTVTCVTTEYVDTFV